MIGKIVLICCVLLFIGIVDVFVLGLCWAAKEGDRKLKEWHKAMDDVQDNRS